MRTVAVLAGLALAGANAPAFGASGSHHFSGLAAYYSPHYHGRTAAGMRYDPNRFTAAHRTLPFGTHVRVTDRRSGRSVEVIVNDRGPFNRGRVIDLSLAAAKRLGMIDRGLARVDAMVIGR
jgi:rare lipoprotein A